MNLQENVPGVGTSSGPSFCIVKGIPYLAWKGSGTDQGIYWSKASSLTPDSNGKYDWQPQTHIPNVGTSASPTLAAFGGSLYMAWKGMEKDNAIYFSKLDGNTWSPQQKLTAGTSTAPALAGTGKDLILVWKGESDVDIWWFKSTDGKTWTAQATVPGVGGTSNTPALAASGDDAYMVWKAEPGDNRLFWTKYNGGTGKWEAQQKITSGTSNGPGVTCDSNGVVWIAWQAVSGEGVFYCSLTNESKNQWSPQVRRFGIGTSDRPCLAAPGKGEDGIIMAWKGAGSDAGIYYGPLILQVAGSVTYELARTNIGRGSSSSMAIQAQLTLNQNGSCTYSGTFWNEAVLKESWYCTLTVLDGNGHAYAFTSTGDIGPGTQQWNTPATNLAIAQNWAGIVLTSPPPGGFGWHSGDSDDVWGSILGAIEATGVAIKDVFEVIGKALASAGDGGGEAGSEPSGE
jgi:hypothetical protein